MRDSLSPQGARDIPRLRPRPHRARQGVPLDFAPLRRIRVEMDLSQEDLARRAGLEPMVVSRIERGATRFPSLPELLLISRALGVPITELYTVIG